MAGLAARYLGAGSSGGAAHTSPVQSLADTLAVSLPAVTGARPVCALPPQQAWPLSSHLSPRVALCTAVHAGWSVGVIALWILALLGTAAAVRQCRRSSALDDGPREEARLFGRLALLGGAALTFTVYALSAAPAVDPRYTTRYLSFLWFAVPALVSVLLPRTDVSTLWRRGVAASRVAALPFQLTVLALGTIDAYHAVPWTQWRNQQEQALVDTLVRTGAVHIYSDYWTCDRVAFESRERVACAVLGPDLEPGWDRYPPYRAIVRQDPNAAYVFPLGSPQLNALNRRLARSARRYRRFPVGGDVVYRPL